MLFTQIIAFITVMVLYEAYRPGPPELSVWETLVISAGFLGWFVVISRFMTQRLRKKLEQRAPINPSKAFRRMEIRLHLMAVLCLGLILSVADLKAQLMSIHLMQVSQTVSGLSGIILYLIHLVIVWSALHRLDKQIYGRSTNTREYISGQIRLVGPVIFPWFLAVLFRDLAGLVWPGRDTWLDTMWGDLVFLIFFLGMLSVFFPPLVRSWWGCTPLPQGTRRRVMETVLDHVGVKVREILSWPLMEGRVLTAGVLGVAARFRYLLVTPALAEALDNQELAAVVAHEAGHVRHRHLLFYLLFFVGFFLAVFALAGPMDAVMSAFVYYLAGSAWGAEALSGQGPGGAMLDLALALPMVLLLVLYLRFAMGFFMRHFERQADFFSLEVMGEPGPLVRSLEKISLYSGNRRDLPSWHHFSVAERVEALEKAGADRRLIRGEARLLRKVGAIYLGILALMIITGQMVGGLHLDQDYRRSAMIRLLERQVAVEQGNPALWNSLGVLRLDGGDEPGALSALSRAASLAPGEPEVLNSLAWLLATAHDPSIRRPRESLILAQEAVRLSPSPHIWDTLAEAYYVSGQPEKALAAARSALAAGPKEKRDYYEDQLKRFEKASKGDS